MIGSRSSKRYAITGFLLVSALVLGGLSWATAVRLRLARVEMETRDRESRFQERERRNQALRQAVWRLDDFVVPILADEYSRPYTDYIAYHYNAQTIWSPAGERFAPGSFILESPLVGGPTIDWIELYFQVDPDGVWTSPQVPDLAEGPDERLQATDDLSRDLAWFSLNRLKEALPADELHSRLARASGGGTDGAATGDDSQLPTTFEVGQGAWQPPVAGDSKARLWQARSRLPSRLSSLTQQACDHAHLVRNTIRNRVWSGSLLAVEDDSAQEVAVEASALRSFWLRELGAEHQRLVFLRTIDADGEIVYQGFTVLWKRLEERLLAEIDDLVEMGDLPAQVELLPVVDPERETLEVCQASMVTLPLRLRVPDAPLVHSAGVWPSVKGEVLTVWAAAIAVLALAGLGVRSLVVLTERRLQFAYAVTHELRTPLTTFQLYSDMLAAGLVPEESKQQYLETLNSESERLSALVEGVLDYARLENHKVTLNPVTTDGAALLARLSRWFEERCRRHGVRLEVKSEIPDDQPIRTDIDLVSQITGVLVNNACRHACDAGDPMVHIKLGLDNGLVTLDVVDTGRGIDRSDARRIFRPFRRGKRADSNAQGGIGLGLALARGWAKVLGGRLELVDRNDPVCGGAHFRLAVPNQSDGRRAKQRSHESLPAQA